MDGERVGERERGREEGSKNMNCDSPSVIRINSVLA